MKITSRILSIPPYLSTTWKNIVSLHIRPDQNLFTLIVLLQNRVQIEVPGLDKEIVDEIFEAHARFADEEGAPKFPIDSPFSFSLPFLSEKSADEIVSTSFQHNPEQSDLPPLETSILQKIVSVIKAFGQENLPFSKKPEENCNCMYCQLGRATLSEEPILEEVSPEDLHFRDWEIVQTADQLYSVTNPLDTNEQYNVFLGSPIGCTCGSKDCEHIRAVLKT